MEEFIEAALEAISTLKKCHEDKETRVALIDHLDYLLKVSARRIHYLRKTNEEAQERLLKISQICDPDSGIHTTFSMGAKDDVEEDDDL